MDPGRNCKCSVKPNDSTGFTSVRTDLALPFRELAGCSHAGGPARIYSLENFDLKVEILQSGLSDSRFIYLRLFRYERVNVTLVIRLFVHFAHFVVSLRGPRSVRPSSWEGPPPSLAFIHSSVILLPAT